MAQIVAGVVAFARAHRLKADALASLLAVFRLPNLTLLAAEF